MARKRGSKGKMLSVGAPEWEPLLNVAARHVDEFMWMCPIELVDGTRLQAYKNYWTREYIHLDGDGRAFVCIDPDRYEEIDLDWALFRALNEDVLNRDRCGSSWGRKFDAAAIELHWMPSATSRGIPRERAEQVIRSCGLRYSTRSEHNVPEPHNWPVLFLGEDAERVSLEVVAITVDEEEFLVIHASEMRGEYGGLLARACEWRP